MSKVPDCDNWFQFYPDDWKRDMGLHPLHINGAWILGICHFWKEGKATHNLFQWARIMGVTEDDARDIIDYIKSEEIGDVSEDANGRITLVSRRRLSDVEKRLKTRESNRERQKRYRENNRANADVTPPKPPKKDNKKKDTYTEEFLAFWDAYPNKKAKGDAFKAWKKIKPNTGATKKHFVEVVIKAVKTQSQSKGWTKDDGQFIPYPATWLNGRRWEDEIEQVKKEYI